MSFLTTAALALTLVSAPTQVGISVTIEPVGQPVHILSMSGSSGVLEA